MANSNFKYAHRQWKPVRTRSETSLGAGQWKSELGSFNIETMNENFANLLDKQCISIYTHKGTKILIMTLHSGMLWTLLVGCIFSLVLILTLEALMTIVKILFIHTLLVTSVY